MKPTPLETHFGIKVKREDLHPSGFPSGKLRGVLPYFADLKAAGVQLVVNAGATHSNSHAIVSYAAKQVGLSAATFVNSSFDHPATEAALKYGTAQVVKLRPMHLGPLRAKASNFAFIHRGFMLPWGMASPEIIQYYAAAVDEVPAIDGQCHVVPFGAGGWTAGVWAGLMAAGRVSEVVVAVPVMPTETDTRKLRAALATGRPPGFGEGTSIYTRMPKNVIMRTHRTVVTPWPSDPRYEHPAWGVALDLAVAGAAVVFWSIGQPVA